MKTPASVSAFPNMAGSMFTFQIEGPKTEVLVEPAFLEWAPSPGHLAAVIGHEAVHIGLFAKLGISQMPQDQEEVIADLIAATSVPNGACLLVETYEWHLSRLEPDGNTALAQRVAILKPLCLAQSALE